MAPPAPPRTVRAGTRIRTIPFSAEGDSDRYRANRYRRAPQRLLHQRELRIVLEAARVLAEEHGGAIPRLLDVPCGFGRFLSSLRPFTAMCAGADLSEAQARQARSSGAPVLAGNLLAGLPFPDGSFDLVLCIRLLHHLHDARDRRAALVELARCSRGHVLCSYYGGDVRLWKIHRKTLEALRLKKPRVAVVDPETFARDAADAGLRVARAWDVLPVLHAHRIVLLERTR